jgi:hypothetical protein
VENSVLNLFLEKCEKNKKYLEKYPLVFYFIILVLYKQHNKMDLDQIRAYIIQDFLQLFKGDLLPDDLVKITTYLNKLTNLMAVGYATSKHGSHYKNCAWSSNYAESGPDTCSCCSLRFEYHDVLNRINLYRRFKNLNKIEYF